MSPAEKIEISRLRKAIELALISLDSSMAYVIAMREKHGEEGAGIGPSVAHAELYKAAEILRTGSALARCKVIPLENLLCLPDGGPMAP